MGSGYHRALGRGLPADVWRDNYQPRPPTKLPWTRSVGPIVLGSECVKCLLDGLVEWNLAFTELVGDGCDPLVVGLLSDRV